ncbi:MAG: hypothetical protein ACI88A_000238 [Paraglaciecola sp.]|jgi:hypothetical protein
MRRYLLAAALTIFLGGCASTQGNLYWGSYSSTLYDLKKEPSEQTRGAHIESLQDIISKSTAKSLRIPPGVYAELGQMMLEDGNTPEGSKYLSLEVSTYPESAKLVAIIQQRIAG